MRSPGVLRAAVLPLALVASAFAGACFADGEVKGGDASADVSKAEASASDAAAFDATCTSDGGAPTFTTLYADYFGPTGKGQCGKASGCHLDAVGGGEFWICGTTKESCWQGLQKVTVPCDAPSGRVPEILRKASEPGAIGKMPADPVTVTYDANDVAKITSWINAGAKND